MLANAPGPGTLFQYRKGGDVLLARAVAGKAGKLAATGEDGKRFELPPDRVLQVAGEIDVALSDGDARARLRDVRAEAEKLVASVDLALLWEQVRASLDGAPIDELVSVYFGRSGSGLERLAFGFALCADRTYFRQKGDRFVARMESEVTAAIERREQERRAAERRAAFLTWARTGIEKGAMPGAPPEGSESELAAIEDLAVRGDDALHSVRAKTLLREIAGEGDVAAGRARPAGAPRYAPTSDGAFDFLVRLGIFTEHENLPLRRTGIPAAFPPAILAAASVVPRYEPGEHASAGRRKLPEGLVAVTIDDAETEDRDDAVTIERLADGGYRLGIHISDVAYFVPRGSALDGEALRRGTTVYLPRGKLAMFPPVLSEGRMSLDADGAPRPALSFYVTLSSDLAPVADEIATTELTIARNLSYDEVDAAIDGRAPDAWGEAKLLDAIGQKLAAGRIAAGALELRTPEVKVLVDAAGEVTIKRIEARSASRALVAELMILANSIAARFCRDRDIPAVYRRQSGPGEPMPERSAFESAEVWAFECRRRLSRTDLGPTPGRHHTLGLECYLQATSPIRRYQDLVVERQIKASLAGEPLPYSPDDMLALAGSAEASTGETVAVERETTLYWVLRYLGQRRGEALEAVVLMERDGKYLVELVETLHRTFVRSRQRWEVGARVKVKVEGANPRRGEITIVPA